MNLEFQKQMANVLDNISQKEFNDIVSSTQKRVFESMQTSPDCTFSYVKLCKVLIFLRARNKEDISLNLNIRNFDDLKLDLKKKKLFIDILNDNSFKVCGAIINKRRKNK